MSIRLSRAVCGNIDEATRREWLVTNGIGGFAAGTIAGLPTRAYHGLLVAALNPPLGRTVLLTKTDETAHYGGQSYDLSANQWSTGDIAPQGYKYLESFHLEGTVPVWRYAIGDAVLERRVWMAQGENTTYIRYNLHRALEPLTLDLKAIVNYRSFHTITQTDDDWHMDIRRVTDGVMVTAFSQAVPFQLLMPGASAQPQHTWYQNYLLRIEAYRGLDSLDDNLHVALFSATLNPGDHITLTATTQPNPDLDSSRVLEQRKSYELGLIQQSRLQKSPTKLQQLVLAADQFIVDRTVAGEPGKSVIAGYHWFGDWGRDTMISLPGLTIATRRFDVAERILRTFGAYVAQGMLPNRFPDEGERPEYNTVDATLWYFEALRAYYTATNDRAIIEDLFPVLEDIIEWHEMGTRYGIRVDPDDGLLQAGQPGVQLTWMDAKVGDWVVTPRMGKPIEVNALWYNALLVMMQFAETLRKDHQHYAASAQRVQQRFHRYWNANTGYCYDVLDGPNGSDASLRPNQLFAVSLNDGLLTPAQQKAVVDTCARHLLTTHGLRSLSPDDPNYVAEYRGEVIKRDGAYHQGTVWGWLIGPFVEAHLRVYGDKAAARAFLIPLVADQLSAGCVGSLAEIFDGDAPHEPRGAAAQAWTVAEVLRTWLLTG